MTRANCPECGATLSGSPPTCPTCGPPFESEPEREQRAWPWVLAAVAGCGLVLAVVGLLAILVLPNVMARLQGAQRSKIRADLTAIESALKEYAINGGGEYPIDLQALVIPDEHGYTYLDRLPLDPWKRPYRYDPPSPPDQPEPRLYTLGSDGVPGGSGDAMDVDNWILERTK